MSDNALVADAAEGELLCPFPVDKPPAWSGATWVGAIADNDRRLASGAPLALRHGAGFTRARLLARHDNLTRGFVQVPVVDGAVDASRLRSEIDALPAVDGQVAAPAIGGLPSITVALCTRDRFNELKLALPPLLALSYPELTILIVDNASRTNDTMGYVESLADPRVRAVYEPRPGLSAARNRALVEAKSDWVAFTDDDVVVDPEWLVGIARGVARDQNAGIVCGMVVTGELVSPTQLYFERRIEWVGAVQSRVFDMTSPPADVPLFPFEVGLYGTGANFAVDRRLAIGLGGFNEVLGAGTPTGGGEDIDMFVRAIIAGRPLVREASAIVWHRHRVDDAGLRRQMRSYGTGMAAWITATLRERETRGLALRRMASATGRIRSLGSLSESDEPADSSRDDVNRELRSIEVRGMLMGPASYARSRLAGRSSRPLRDARV